MPAYRAMLLGVGTFVVCLALCLAIFLALDVELVLLVGPAMAVAAASYAAYKSAAGYGSP